MNKLNLNQDTIAQCRALAADIAQEVQDFIDLHTTLSVERSVLRLLGVDGVDAFDVPLPNLFVDQVKEEGDLSRGISVYLASALTATGLSLEDFCGQFLSGGVKLVGHPLLSREQAQAVLQPYLEQAFATIADNRRHREAQLARFGSTEPEIYVIVATGNIYEDVKQAQAAAMAGADVIAVIRSTGQSLLDYVPYGATTEGFGGTLATQENFRIMRRALDEVGEQLGRYIKLVNYASGLCMPEIAAMGALERLDMMLNDSMYGIIFRDINMQRTFVDQYFSRSLNALAGITINTGEDNYLTTADAIEGAHTVLASQFINERFAILAGLPEEQMGLGHAFEINPESAADAHAVTCDLLTLLEEPAAPPPLLPLFFRLRLASGQGFAPHLNACQACGRPARDLPRWSFNAGRGGIACPTCRDSDFPWLEGRRGSLAGMT